MIKTNFFNWVKLYMPPKQTCVCLTNSFYENGCVFAKTKPQSIIVTTALQKVKKEACLSPQLNTTVG